MFRCLTPTASQITASHLIKALLHSNELAQCNLCITKSRQASQYNNKSKKDWEPFEPGQAVWLWHWKVKGRGKLEGSIH